jgi:hypothetical protein
MGEVVRCCCGWQRCCTMFRLEQDFPTPNNARCGKELVSTVFSDMREPRIPPAYYYFGIEIVVIIMFSLVRNSMPIASSKILHADWQNYWLSHKYCAHSNFDYQINMFLYATEYLWHSRQSSQMHVRVSALRIKDCISLVGMLYRCICSMATLQQVLERESNVIV